MPILTYIIIGITVLVSIQGFNSVEFLSKMTFSPYLIKHHNQKYRFLSHILIHGDWPHLIFNMFSFYFLGSYMELTLKAFYGMQLGSVHFLFLYIAGGFLATLWPFIRNQDNDRYQSLGASGAVSAVIFAFVMWWPNESLLLFAILPIKAYVFGPLYLAIEYFSFRAGKGNVAHDAHLGGAIFGVLYILIINVDKGKEFIHLIFG